MIPKTIHYCWFGNNEKSGLINECIESWRKYLPDYEIIEWNENNFNIESNKYVSQAYNCKKWAFVSDYVRLYVLYNYGGIYFDTDVEVLKSMDGFLCDPAFAGFESNDSVATAVMGCEEKNKIFGELLRQYECISFIDDYGKMDLQTNTHRISSYLISIGIKTNGKKQAVNGFNVYPSIYFSPNNISRIWNRTSPKSYTIHHFDQSWIDNKKNEMSFYGKIRRFLVGIARNAIGTETLERIKNKGNR